MTNNRFSRAAERKREQRKVKIKVERERERERERTRMKSMKRLVICCALWARTRKNEIKKEKQNGGETTHNMCMMFTLVAYLWIDCTFSVFSYELLHKHSERNHYELGFTLFHILQQQQQSKHQHCICRSFIWGGSLCPIEYLYAQNIFFRVMIARRRWRKGNLAFRSFIASARSTLLSSVRWWWTTNMWTKFGK